MKKLAAVAAAAAILGFGSNAMAAQYELKIQAAQGSSSIYTQVLERLGDRIEKLSQGQIAVEILPEGAVVKAGGILDSVNKGLVNGGQAWAHYWSGKHPAGVLFSSPTAGLGMGLDQDAVMSWFLEGEGAKLFDEYYQQVLKMDVKPYLCMPMGPEPFGWFKQSYKSLEEIRKVKFRSPPGVPALSFQELGMKTVAMPGPDIIPAAQRGVIDAAEWISPADDAILGFQEIWKHFYLQGLHQVISIGDVIINKTWYNSLPQHLQYVIDESMKACVTDMKFFNVSANSAALKKLVQEQGVVIEDTPTDYVAAYMAAAKKVNDRFAKDPFYAKVYQSLQDWAHLTVPYQKRCNGVYYNMGQAAMDAGVITDYQK